MPGNAISIRNEIDDAFIDRLTCHDSADQVAITVDLNTFRRRCGEIMVPKNFLVIYLQVAVHHRIQSLLEKLTKLVLDLRPADCPNYLLLL